MMPLEATMPDATLASGLPEPPTNKQLALNHKIGNWDIYTKHHGQLQVKSDYCAFAHITGGNESVNRNTGSLSFTHTLISLRGKVDSVNLNLAVTYGYGLKGSFGLPKNWTLNIPFVIPGHSVTTQGRTYAIDKDWYDSTGYRSGLKYINNHGMKFEPATGDGRLPSGQPGSYSWRLRMSDGACDYYDQLGKIIEHADIFGNTLRYVYVNQLANPQFALLDYIQDSWGNKVKFQYQLGSMMRVIGPDGAQTEITFTGQGIRMIKDAMDYKTTFIYNDVSFPSILTIIKYPTTLQARFEYVGMKYFDRDGNVQSIPAVQNHYHLEGNGSILSRTNYRYGESTSGGTYTGFAAHHKFDTQTDILMESGNHGYRYDTLVSNMSPDGKLLSATRVVFNYLHLPMEEHHYDLDGQGKLVPGYKSLYTYKIQADHARSTNYAQPIQTEQQHYTGSAFQGLRRVSMTYDPFGSILKSHEEMWSADAQNYVVQRRTTNTYAPTSWGGQLLESETFSDEISGSEKCVQYEPTSDQKKIQSAQVLFMVKGDTVYSHWKTKTISYDNYGRTIGETVTWANGASIPEGSITTYTNKNKYDYDSHGFDIVTKIDPQGHAAVSRYDVKAQNGPLVLMALPMGETESFEFDKIGRCIKYTDPFGKSTKTEYVFGNSGNTVTTTSSLGYIIRRTYDLHGQEIEVSDNGNPMQPAPLFTPNRVLLRKAYDSLSRMISQTDALGLKTSYGPYDAFSRLLATTDPEGNQVSYVYNDYKLTFERFVNKDLRETTQLDAFSRAVTVSSHPDSTNGSTNYILVTEKLYDGSDNTTQTKLIQKSQLNGDVILLKTTAMSRNVESAVVSSELSVRTDLAENAFDTVHLAVQYEHKSSISIYEDCKLLVAHRNQLGQEEKYSYDANGRKTSMTRFEGTVVNYEHDAVGRTVVTSTNDPPQATKTTYLDTGQVATLETATGIIQYKYSLDGSCTGVEYPDGSQQTYALDQYGRILKSVDARGTEQINAFDSAGRVASRTLGPDTVTYKYGEVNHSKGLPIEYSLAGTQNLVTALEYDGFDRLIRMTVKDSNHITVLETKLSYNSRGKLQRTELSSEFTPTSPELNHERHFSYDGLGQLRKEVVMVKPTNISKTTEYAYDGNSNIISITVNGEKKTRAYNAIDQRTDPGFEYDRNGRQTQDDQMRKYRYNANDQLIEVKYQGSSTRFLYHPDGSMSQHLVGTSATKLYYDCGSINVTTTKQGDTDTGKGVSYLLGPGSRMSSYTGNAEESRVFVESQSSTSLVLTRSPPPVAHSYGPFGEATSTIPSGADFYFGYQQELTDALSSLIYLRSRFYQPSQASFLTMDSARKSNRYAFCEGDPVNLADPTGHAGEAGMIAGLAVGIIGTVALAAATAGLGAAIFGAETVAASMFVGAISGAGGAVAGDATTASINGAIGGVVGGWAGTAAGDKATACALARHFSQKSVARIGFVTSGTIGGAAGSFSSAGSMAAMTGTSPFNADTAISTTVGGLLGAAGGLHCSFAWRAIRDPWLMPVKVTARDFNDINNQPAHPFRTKNDFRSSSEPVEYLRDFTDLLQQEATRPMVGQDINTPQLQVGGPLDTFIIHGEPGWVKPYMDNPGCYRPMKSHTFAEYLASQGWGDNQAPMMLTSCHGAALTGKVVAKRLKRPVYAAYNEVDIIGDGGQWKLFQ
ncbi:hypothetical protein B7494_g8135 [Chlorociboria aeruginascens]|nr:hypothetical protein B7494_g8135 [Chlorociboria aeruginascens]